MKNADPREATAAARPLALIAAGGEGKRLGAEGPKALVLCAERPLLSWTLDGFAASEVFGGGAGLVVVAAHASALAEFEQAAAGARDAGLDVLVTEGGASRSHSVAAALRAGLAHEGDAEARVHRVALVHDAARVLAPARLIDGLAADLIDSEPNLAGLIAARPLVDTVKRVNESLTVVETPTRSELWAVQTPQAFKVSALAHALGITSAVGDAELSAATDDASLVERAGGNVKIYPWSEPNPKVTTADDLIAAEGLLRSGA